MYNAEINDEVCECIFKTIFMFLENNNFQETSQCFMKEVKSKFKSIDINSTPARTVILRPQECDMTIPKAIPKEKNQDLIINIPGQRNNGSGRTCVRGIHSLRIEAEPKFGLEGPKYLEKYKQEMGKTKIADNHNDKDVEELKETLENLQKDHLKLIDVAQELTNVLASMELEQKEIKKEPLPSIYEYVSHDTPEDQTEDQIESSEINSSRNNSRNDSETRLESISEHSTTRTTESQMSQENEHVGNNMDSISEQPEEMDSEEEMQPNSENVSRKTSTSLDEDTNTNTVGVGSCDIINEDVVIFPQNSMNFLENQCEIMNNSHQRSNLNMQQDDFYSVQNVASTNLASEQDSSESMEQTTIGASPDKNSCVLQVIKSSFGEHNTRSIMRCDSELKKRPDPPKKLKLSEYVSVQPTESWGSKGSEDNTSNNYLDTSRSQRASVNQKTGSLEENCTSDYEDPTETVMQPGGDIKGYNKIQSGDLDFMLIKKSLVDSDVDTKLRVLQALRWRLTRTYVNIRDQNLLNYIRHDILFIDTKPAIIDSTFLASFYCPKHTTTPHPLQEEMARFINTLASLSVGRIYLERDSTILDDIMLPLLMGHLEGIKVSDLTREFTMAAVQKMSLSNKMREVIISAGVVEWLVNFILKNHASMTNYEAEYSVAMFTNLCINKETRTRCEKIANEVVSAIIDLINTPHNCCLPYLTGILYSLLSSSVIYEKAANAGLEKKLKELYYKLDDDLSRNKLEVIMSMNDPSEYYDSAECNCDESVDAQNYSDYLEPELDRQDPVFLEPTGEKLLEKFKYSNSTTNTDYLGATFSHIHVLKKNCICGSKSKFNMLESKSNGFECIVEQDPPKPPVDKEFTMVQQQVLSVEGEAECDKSRKSSMTAFASSVSDKTTVNQEYQETTQLLGMSKITNKDNSIIEVVLSEKIKNDKDKIESSNPFIMTKPNIFKVNGAVIKTAEDTDSLKKKSASKKVSRSMQAVSSGSDNPQVPVKGGEDKRLKKTRSPATSKKPSKNELTAPKSPTTNKPKNVSNVSKTKRERTPEINRAPPQEGMVQTDECRYTPMVLPCRLNYYYNPFLPCFDNSLSQEGSNQNNTKSKYSCQCFEAIRSILDNVPVKAHPMPKAETCHPTGAFSTGAFSTGVVYGPLNPTVLHCCCSCNFPHPTDNLCTSKEAFEPRPKINRTP